MEHLGVDFITHLSHGKHTNKIKKICGESSFTETEISHLVMKGFNNSDAHRINPNELAENKLWKSGIFLGKEQKNANYSAKK